MEVGAIAIGPLHTGQHDRELLTSYGCLRLQSSAVAREPDRERQLVAAYERRVRSHECEFPCVATRGQMDDALGISF
jgi:hypothetical protein